ncbi:acyltransferase [Candidatus Pelagibacter bacterium]|nr:acyltransferase [Candidatus Pelagibacter bacterium]
MIKLKYRPEIDTLRAIAVLAVIIYHANFYLFGNLVFSGGYLGVDIFFIISGYLITSIILKELIEKDSFSFKNFYIKRIKRILPALLFIMLVSIPFSWIYLYPTDLVSFSKSILYSLGFTSNFYFHFSGLEYGSPEGLLKPFLHTWSLSVEEQYYILFPIGLVLVFKFLRKHLLYFFLICFVISLLLADWGSKNYPSATFYFLHTRIWELILGSLLAYYEIKLGHRGQNKILCQIFPILGLTLIVYSFFSFDGKIFHPSFYTLIPAIGVSLILWFSYEDNFILKILSYKVFVKIGLISYSLYLWHYPIFSFANHLEIFFNNNLEKFLLILVTFILSIFTYCFIEQPARKKVSLKIIISLLTIIFFIIVTYSATVITMEGFTNRLKVKNYQKKHTFLYLEQDNEPCFGRICNFGSKEQKIILLGDSHLGSLAYDLYDKTKSDYSFLSITSAGYFHLKNVDQINKHSKKINIDYDNLRIKIDKILKKSRDNIIILGGATSLYFYNKRIEDRALHWDNLFVDKKSKKHNPQVVERAFIDLIDELSKNNEVILLYPIPEIGRNLQKKKFENMVRVFNYKYSDFLNQNKEVIEFFDSINKPRVHKVYSYKAFCKKESVPLCSTHDKNNFFFYDGYHPSLIGAKMINDLIIKKINYLNK